MDWPGKIRKHFLGKISFLQDQIIDVEKSRQASPSPTESHSDTSRSQLEKLANALIEELKQLEGYIKLVPESNINPENKVEIWSYLEILLDGKKIKMVLVPQGMGGEKVEDIQLVSTESPLGKAIYDLGEASKFNLHNLPGEILKIG